MLAALVKLERVVGELTETALKIEKVLEGDEQDEGAGQGACFLIECVSSNLSRRIMFFSHSTRGNV